MSTTTKLPSAAHAAYELLDPQQQDQLFYALDWARSAAREFHETAFGTPATPEFELALAEAYVEGLRDDSLDAIGMS